MLTKADLAARILKLPVYDRQRATLALGALVRGNRDAAVVADAPRLTLREYVAAAWHIVEPATPFVPGWHLDAICEHLEAVSAGQIRNLLINVPPRHGKSLLVSVFWPTWEWTFAPAVRWLFASYAQSLSTRDSLKCRRIIESPWYQERWGAVYQLTGDQNIKTRYDNTRTGYRIATSVGGAVTGEGADRLVSDDPHHVNERESDLKRESVLSWWDEVMSTRLNDPKTGTRVIVMQRIHEQDLAGHVLERANDAGRYEHLRLPAEFDGKRTATSTGWEDPRRTDGALLWPDRFGPAEVAEAKRTLGSYAYAAQFQQTPAPASGGMFKREWFRFYDYLPHDVTERLQSWDMAFKGLDDSDFVVGQVWARKGADCYLVDQFRDQVNFPDTIRAVRHITGKHPLALGKLVEDKANGPAVIATLQREIVGLIAVDPEGGKEARAAAVSPVIEAGNVWLPNPVRAPWVEDFLLECERFPRGQHDDQVDAMTQALLRLSLQDDWTGVKPQKR